MRYSLWSLTLLGALLDIACLKWIRVAHVLIYVEILFTALSALVPFENGFGASQTLVVLSLLSALCFSCDPIPNFISMAALLICLAFIQLPLVW